MTKTDLESTFRLIPIHPDDWNLLGIDWQLQHYVDMYLPFGIRSAPFPFNQLSDGLDWVLKTTTASSMLFTSRKIFFTPERNKLDYLTSFSTLLRVFTSLKAPVVASKTIGPSREIEFMGIILDRVRMEARLSQDKLVRINQLLNCFKNRRSVCLVDRDSPVCM